MHIMLNGLILKGFWLCLALQGLHLAVRIGLDGLLLAFRAEFPRRTKNHMGRSPPVRVTLSFPRTKGNWA